MEIDTEQARRTVLLEPYQEGKAQCIIISGVAQGSQAWDAGVRPGQRLVGISDPNNNDQVWELNASTSLRFVRDALRFRIAASIRFDVDTDVIVPAAAPEAAASDGDQDVALKRAPSGAVSSVDALDSVLGTDDDEGDSRADSTVAERLEQTYKCAPG